MANQPEDDKIKESRRILDNLQSQEGHLLGRTAQRLDDHLNAADADQNDQIEVWGTRIGRIIALTATLVIVAWALAWLFAK